MRVSQEREKKSETRGGGGGAQRRDADARMNVKHGRKIKPTNVIINPNALLQVRRSHKFSINSDNRGTLIAGEITAS